MTRRRCKLSRYKYLKLLEMFVEVYPHEQQQGWLESTVISHAVIRQIIATGLEDESPFDGQIEVDESYFGGVRKGKRDRGVEVCRCLACSSVDANSMMT